MTLRSTESLYIDMSKRKIKSSYKYHLAFRYIKELILAGMSDFDILKDFNEKHISNPDIYCTAGGKPLTIGILRNFRRGIKLQISRKATAINRFAANKEIVIREATRWKQKSVGYLWVINEVKAGNSYGFIVDEFNRRHEQNPEEYSTRTGKPLTSAILSNWIKEAGLDDLRPGNGKNIKEWKQSNKGYLWFTEQIKKGICQDEVIKQYNSLHEIDPNNYSTFLGSAMTEQTFHRWKKEILDNN